LNDAAQRIASRDWLEYHAGLFRTQLKDSEGVTQAMDRVFA
jgi:hypothetical protein